jgi:isoaspartyl peptidase/L-asparaginase-like protein (Ntn-hydrolase superfamily)
MRRRPAPVVITRTVINKMFEIAGHDVTFEQVAARKDAWYQDWTMTREQDEEWKKWMKEYFIKECKFTPKLAEREAAMCSLNWGLKHRDNE